MQSLNEAFGLAMETLVGRAPRILAAVLLFLFVGAVGHLLGVLVGRVLERTGRAGKYARLARRAVGWTVSGLGLVLALHALGLTAMATSVLATGGLMAVILGFAFKDIGENLLAGVFLALSRSFDVGDLIESGGLRGVVKSIDLRDTHIRTADGCDIFIPSAAIFRNPLLNFTRDGLRRGSFTVGIDYGNDPALALRLLREAIPRVEGVLADPPPAVEVSDLSGSWVEIRAHVWVDTFDGAALEPVLGAVMTEARRVLREGGFTFSSDVTTALAVSPLQVRMQGGE